MNEVSLFEHKINFPKNGVSFLSFPLDSVLKEFVVDKYLILSLNSSVLNKTSSTATTILSEDQSLLN